MGEEMITNAQRKGWQKQIDLLPAFSAAGTTNEKRAMVAVELLRPEPAFSHLIPALEKAAKKADKDECRAFDAVLDQIFDIADRERIWIKTF